MHTECNDLDAFFDGQLCAAAHAHFRRHLAACQECQVGLHDRLQLSLLTHAARPRPGVEVARAVAAVAYDLVCATGVVAMMVVGDIAMALERSRAARRA